MEVVMEVMLIICLFALVGLFGWLGWYLINTVGVEEIAQRGFVTDKRSTTSSSMNVSMYSATGTYTSQSSTSYYIKVRIAGTDKEVDISVDGDQYKKINVHDDVYALFKTGRYDGNRYYTKVLTLEDFYGK